MKSMRVGILAILLSCLLAIESRAAMNPSAEIEMKVKTVMIDPNGQTPVLVLEGATAQEYLPIWIDLPEAQAIAMEIEQVKTARPLTHDLVRNMLKGLGARVTRVTINTLRNNTYFASISLAIKSQTVEIDSRPSDAIAIALRMHAPIFVSSRILEQAKARVESPTGGPPVQRRLGIQVQELNSELALLMNSQLTRGLVVTQVRNDSLAMKANIQRGDIITKINDHAMQNLAALETVINTMHTAASIKIELMKKGKPTTLVIELP